MNLIISWLFGWFVGLGAPVLIAAGSAYVIWKAPASWSWLRQPAFIALTVSGCWLGMTFITQSAVSEAIRHERAAVKAAIEAEQNRQRFVGTTVTNNATIRAESTAQENAALQQKVAAYETDLAAQARAAPVPAGAPAACLATSADFGRVSDLLR